MTDPVRSFFEHFDAFDPAMPGHRLLLVLSESILILTLLALLFVVLALSLRFQHIRHERKWRQLHAKWDNLLLDALSGAGSPDDLHKLVDKGQELDFVRFLAPYGYRLRGSDLAVLAALAQPYLGFVAERLQQKSPGVRVWAINVLDLFGMPAYEEQLASCLDDASPAVTMFAASTLLAHQCTQFVDKILEQLPRFDKWNINALAALLVRAGPTVMPLLETVYIDRSRPLRSRIIAAETLGRGNAYRALNSALLVLGAESDQDLLVATLRLLGRISQGRQVESVRVLCRSSNDVLRTNAMHTLRQLAIAADQPLFRRAMDDPNPWVARQAALALQDLGDIAGLQQVANDPAHARSMLARQVLAAMG